MVAAERLIADEGVNQVSMRKINSEAGTKNLSAVHYHFGSLEAVVAAILDHRMSALEIRRSAMVDELNASKSTPVNIFQVLHAVVWPLAEQMMSQAGTSHYVRFLAAVNRMPRYDRWQGVPHRTRRSLVRCYILLRRLITDIPKDVLHTRMIIEMRSMLYCLADVDLMIRDRHPNQRDQLVLFHASDLVTRAAAALTVPVSESTQLARLVLQSHSVTERAPVFGIDAVWALSGLGSRNTS